MAWVTCSSCWLLGRFALFKLATIVAGGSASWHAGDAGVADLFRRSQAALPCGVCPERLKCRVSGMTTVQQQYSSSIGITGISEQRICRAAAALVSQYRFYQPAVGASSDIIAVAACRSCSSSKQEAARHRGILLLFLPRLTLMLLKCLSALWRSTACASLRLRPPSRFNLLATACLLYLACYYYTSVHLRWWGGGGWRRSWPSRGFTWAGSRLANKLL